MSTRDGALPGGDTGGAIVVEPLPFKLLDDPLDYLFADNFRHRCVAYAVRRFAEAGSASRRDADTVIVYLDRDLPLHMEDEEMDLFPALRRRAEPSDGLGLVLARLSEDHRQCRSVVEEIIDVLAEHPADDPVQIVKSSRESMLAYAMGEQRHIAIENSVALAIGRRRLTKRDLAAMSRSMKARRGVIV